MDRRKRASALHELHRIDVGAVERHFVGVRVVAPDPV